MEIKFNPDKYNISGPATGFGKEPDTGQPFNIKDTMSRSISPQMLPGRPAFKSVTSAGGPGFDLVTNSGAGNSVSASISPGPIGAALSEQLKILSKNRVKFFRRRGFRIPLIMSKNKEITSEEALNILSEGNESKQKGLAVSVDKSSPVPISGRKELNNIMTYKGLDKKGTRKRDKFMKFLGDIDSTDIDIEIRGTNYDGGYAAYKHLTGMGEEMGISDKPVVFRKDGVDLLSLTRDDVNNIDKISNELKKTRDLLKKLHNKKKLFDMVREPVEGVSISDRVDITNGIYNHSGAYDRDKQVKLTRKDYEYIKKRAKDGKDFAKIGKLYVEMLDTNGESYRRSDYRDGLDFIIDQMKDRPDDFRIFIKLLKKDAPIFGAIKIYEMLPQPVKSGDYDEAAKIFIQSRMYKPDRVKVLMKPIGSTTLKERVDIAVGIYPMTRGDDKQWENTAKDLAYIESLSKNGDDFVKIGKLYKEMLQANGSNYWRKDYHKGLKFIAEKLRNKPDDFKIFTKLLKKDFSISGAIKIYDMLPSTAKKGDYEKAAAVFMNGNLKSPEQIRLVMEPVGDSTLKERHSIARGINKHCKGDYNENQWKYTAKEYKRLKSATKDGNDFVKVGKLYIQMLDANGSNYWRKSYSDGLKLISEELKNKPDNFKTFIRLLKGDTTIPSAIKAYSLLPSSRKQENYENVAEVFKNSELKSTQQVEFIMEPVGDSSLKDRLSIAEGIYKHSRGDYGKDTWKNTTKGYKLLRSLSKDGKDFMKLGKLYLEMLDANGSSYWRKNYATGLKFIAEKLMDRPDDFVIFKKLLKKGASVEGAVRIFDMLPPPAGKDDYKKAADVFMESELKNSHNVELIMPQIGNSSLSDRFEIADGINRHASGGYGTDKWKNTTKGYKYLKSVAGSGDDFARLGKLFVRMLDVKGDSYWRKNYRKGLDFIKEQVGDRPDDYEVFLKLLKHGVNIDAAIKMYELLPQPMKKGDYEKAAKIFMEGDLNAEKNIELIMAPVDDSSLADRLEIARGIYNHASGGYGKDKWKTTAKDYNHIIKLSKNDNDFIGLSRLYIEMLDARNDSYWQKNYRKGLDFISETLKDRPDDFKVFTKLIKKGVSIESAIKMYQLIPDPGKKNAYDEVAKAFMATDLHKPEKVEFLMKPIGTASLKERIRIAEGIYGHSSGDSSKDSWKNTVRSYNYLRKRTAEGDEFVKFGKLYVKMLDSYGSSSWQKGQYRQGLDFILDNCRDDLTKFDFFNVLIKAGGNIPRAVGAMGLIQKPVKNEDFSSRVRVAGKFMDKKFQEKYDIVCRNILPGESLENTANLFKAVISDYNGDTLSECEERLQIIQRNKGPVNSSQIVKLVEAFDFDNIDNLLKALKILTRSMQGDNYKVLEDRFLHFATGSGRNKQKKLNETIKLFETLYEGKDKKETFDQVVLRFNKVHKSVKDVMKGTIEDARGIFIALMKEYEKGTFGDMPVDQVTNRLLASMLVAGNAKDALDHLIYESQKPEFRRIIRGENVVSIGGVRLKVKGRKKK